MARRHVDKYRRPAQQTASFAEIGSSGLKQSGGRLREEFHRDLQGTNAVKVYKEMSANDAIVGAVLFAVSMLMRQARWFVKPADTSAEAVQRATFIESCRHDMSMTWEDVIMEALTMLTFGWSWQEIVYKRRDGYKRHEGESSRYADGLIGWRKMPLRSQDSMDRWELDPTGGITAMVQRSTSGQMVSVPIGKSLLFRTVAHKNNPEGRSILRTAYRPWYFKKRIEEIEGIGIERDLAGLPFIQPPEGADIWNTTDPQMTQLRTDAEQLIRNIRRDEQEGVLLPAGWTLSLLSTGGRRAFDTTGIIDRYNNMVAMSVMADFIILGHNNRYGSFALGRTKTQMFSVAVTGWMETIKAVFNRYAIPRLCLLNGWDIEQLPTLEYEEITTPDLAVIGNFIQALNRAGMKVFPSAQFEDYLLRLIGVQTQGMELGRELTEPATDDDDDEKEADADADAPTETA